MTVSTSGAAVAITPVVLKIFVEHYARKIKKKAKKEERTAKDDILFDEAFNIVKAFIAFACRNTVESLQTFTNTHVPSPYWFKVVPTRIPLSTCTRSASIIRSLLGPEGVAKILGGQLWWTIRGIEGVEAEWVAMKADVRGVPYEEIEKPKGKEKEEKDPLLGRYSQGLDRLQRVMLYIHGGGFYWGSINTHRYQLGRFARKMKNGRVFTVNYRKAPHYPFPCALQDCLAAYLYLISPPTGAPHTAVSPSNIVIAGDSAGGNLALSLLTIIRDYGLPAPAGGVLISPWVDLTHSFPSIMSNTATDILTPHGFIHEPSPLWPQPPVDSETHISLCERTEASAAVLRQENQTFNEDGDASGRGESRTHIRVSMTSESARAVNLQLDADEPCIAEIRSQIQLYATNEQLPHPLVSPLLHASLGGLPPLYILAGDGECLRDEIIFLAHRAAEPKKYRVNNAMSYGDPEKIKEYDNTPTNVRLQVYDEMCHVLTVFTFIDPAHYAYKAVGEFTRQVIPDERVSQAEGGESHGTPARQETLGSTIVGSDDEFEYDEEDSDVPAAANNDPSHSKSRQQREDVATSSGAPSPRTAALSSRPSSPEGLAEMVDEKLTIDTNPTVAPTPTDISPALTPPREETSATLPRPEPISVNTERIKTDMDNGAKEHFVRQRISIKGVPRPMEPESEIPALQLPIDEIGIVKEAPVVRWLTGLQMYDRKYKSSAKKARRTRERNVHRAQMLLDRARTAGVPVDELLVTGEDEETRLPDVLDIIHERPSRSAICGRRDTAESLVLLRNALISRKQYAEARKIRPPTREPTHIAEARHALDIAFEETAHEGLAQASAAERQVVTKTVKAGNHGVKMWSSIMNYYHRRSKEDKKIKRSRSTRSTKPPAQAT